MASSRHWEQDKDSTVYVGNLDERVTDALIWELMLQAGRIENVHLPKDRVTQMHQGYGFVEFISEADAEYAARIMNQIRLYGKPIRVNKASADKQKTVEVGAEVFVGNLDPMADERMLYDVFGRFGTLITAPKIMRDESNLSKGFGFVSYADFEHSDAAIAAMNGAFLMNKEIIVQYAFKKDGKGERHGDEAERLLAAQAQKHGVELNIQPIPANVFLPQVQQAPTAMPNGNPPSAPPAGFVPPNANYQTVPQPQHQRPLANSAPLPPAPSGLPSKPPQSQAGYGGPPAAYPAGFNNAFPRQQQQGPPQQPPVGFAPPPGFGPPPPGPPPPPPGFQPQAYGRR